MFLRNISHLNIIKDIKIMKIEWSKFDDEVLKGVELFINFTKEVIQMK